MWKRYEVAIGFLLATAIWTALFVALSDLPSHYEICEITKEGQKECGAYNIVLFSLIKIGKAFDAWSGFIAAVATVFIARFTLTLKRSTDNLWRVTNDTLRHSEQTAKRQLRAYVFIKSIDVMNDEDPKVIKIMFQNGGSTPAYDVIVIARKLGINDPVIFNPPKTLNSRGNLGPGHDGTMKIAVPEFQNLAIWQLLVAGIKKLYIYGEIRYRDIFDEIHLVKFRYETFASNGGNFAISPEGNQEE